jgi:hypothetical protein
MNLSDVSGIVAGIIFAFSAGWYNVDVYKRKVTPSIATFFMFSIINASLLASLISKGVWSVVPFTLVGLVTSVSVCILSLRNKKIYFELPDKVGLVGALFGFIVWQATDDAAINVYVLSIVNIITFTPLIIKSFKKPNLETIKPWQVNLLASFFLLLAVNSLSPVVWIVPVRQFLCSLLLNAGLYKGYLSNRNDQ